MRSIALVRTLCVCMLLAFLQVSFGLELSLRATNQEQGETAVGVAEHKGKSGKIADALVLREKQDKTEIELRKEAKRLLDAKDPSNAWLLYQKLADISAAQGKQEEEIKIFQEAIRELLNVKNLPNAWAAYQKLENIFVAQGRQKEMTGALREIVAAYLDDAYIFIDEHHIITIRFRSIRLNFSSTAFWDLFSDDLDAAVTRIMSSKFTSRSRALLVGSMRPEQFQELAWSTKIGVLDFSLIIRFLIQFVVSHIECCLLALVVLLPILSPGLVMWAKGEYLHMADYFKRQSLVGSARLLRESRQHVQAAIKYEEAGDAFMRLKHYLEAQEYYKSALSLSSSTDNASLLVKLDRCTTRIQHYEAIQILLEMQSRVSYYVIVDVSRKDLLKNSLKMINSIDVETLSDSKLKVQFAGEMANDEGGPMREWVTWVFKEAVRPFYKLFVSTDKKEAVFQLNPQLMRKNKLKALNALGRIAALAINWRVLIPVRFSSAMLKHMLGKADTIEFSDLAEYDTSIFQSLKNMKMQQFDGRSFEFYVNVAGLEYFHPEKKYVTNANKEEYILWATKVYLTVSIQAQLKEFLGGFHDVVWMDAIQGLDMRGFQLLAHGVSVINVDDWREHTVYHGYRKDDHIIDWFWKTVKSFEPEQHVKLFQFVTGSPCTPVEGFSALEHKFTVWKTSQGDGSYPTASTCFNILYLPSYTTEERLKEQLEVVVEHGRSGFGFI